MQKEALYINKSLTFLEQVVVALADTKREHVPYRQSKLTHFLKDRYRNASNKYPFVYSVWVITKIFWKLNFYFHKRVNRILDLK